MNYVRRCGEDRANRIAVNGEHFDVREVDLTSCIRVVCDTVYGHVRPQRSSALLESRQRRHPLCRRVRRSWYVRVDQSQRGVSLLKGDSRCRSRTIMCVADKGWVL